MKISLQFSPNYLPLLSKYVRFGGATGNFEVADYSIAAAVATHIVVRPATQGGPMIDNPYDGCAGGRFAAAVWGRGYLYGLTGPVDAVDDVDPSPAALSAECRVAFADGAARGHCAAVTGLDIFHGAIDTADRSWFPATAELAVESADPVDGGALDMAKVASSAFAMVLMAATNVMLVNHRLTPPAEVADGLARHFSRTVTALGRPPCEFYLGGAVDLGDVGGELRLTPMYRLLAAARCAAIEFGRPRHFLVGWSTGRPGVLTLLDVHWPLMRRVSDAAPVGSAPTSR